MICYHTFVVSIPTVVIIKSKGKTFIWITKLHGVCFEALQPASQDSVGEFNGGLSGISQSCIVMRNDHDIC